MEIDLSSLDRSAIQMPEKSQRLQQLFNRFSRELDNAFERANDQFSRHMPSKGDICEYAVRQYLAETLGTRYAITDGVIFDVNGNQSSQQDIIIFDDHWSMRFTPRGSTEPAIVPVETVYATIEVKKTLSAKDLREALTNIRSFKSLYREQTGPGHITPNKVISNVGYPGKVDVRNPFISVIFAFSAKRSLKSVFDQLKNDVSNIPPDEWPDIILVHNSGVILPYCTNCNESAMPLYTVLRDGHKPSYVLDPLGQYSLLGFHLLLMACLHYLILGPTMNYRTMYGELANIVRASGLSKV